MTSAPVAIVTGTASGIGLATAQLFLSRNYQVFGVDISELDSSKIDSKFQSSFEFHRVDLGKEGACDEVVKLCLAKFGERIDVLANVAGIMDAFATADTFTDGEWDRVMMVNVTVPMRLMRAVLPSMKAHKNGAIINVASKAATSGGAAGVSYTASKHALLGVTRNTAWRFHEEGIRCNALLPGGVASNISNSMQKQHFDMASFNVMSPVHALHTSQGSTDAPIEPAEIAHAILFLASPEAKSINGIAMPVDKAWGAA